jgi:hypothetical protein
MRRGLVDLEWIALSLQAQARALGGQVAILDAHVELLIDRLADQQADRDDARVAIVDPSAACPHDDDYRLEAGSMRAPLRFYCKACRRFVDPARPSDPDPARTPPAPVDVPS